MGFFVYRHLGLVVVERNSCTHCNTIFWYL